MATLFTNAPAAGNPLPRADYQSVIDLAENSLADLGPFIISGLAISAGAGLNVNVATGVASIGGRLTVSAGFAIAVAASQTNHIYLLNTGAGTSNTTGTAPASSVKLGTAVTDATTVTSVQQNWTSGRQVLVRHENLVHGSGAGHPRAVDLASWHATNNEGNEVKGTLPAGTMPSSVMLKDSDQTVSDGWDLSVGTTNGTKIATATTQKLGFFNATPIVQPANTSDLRTLLINLGLLATGGANPLNTNGGDVTCNTLKTSSGLTGSGTPLVLQVNTITPGSDADVTVSTPQSDLPYQRLDTGSWASGHNVTLPTTTGATYIVRNNSSFSAVFKTAAGTGVTVEAGIQKLITCGGANYIEVAPTAANVFVKDADQTLSDGTDIALGSTNGTKIGTATTQKLGFWNATPVGRPAAYTPTNVTTDRSWDCNATTLDEVADVLATLVQDLQSIGLIG